MRTTLQQVLEGFQELEQAGYKRPQLPKAINDLAEAYLKVLNDLDAEPVAAGFQQAIRSGMRWWPKPGEVRSLALEERRGKATDTRTDLEKRYWEWENAGMVLAGKLAACPVCDVVPSAQGRLTVPHLGQRHREAGVRYVVW